MEELLKLNGEYDVICGKYNVYLLYEKYEQLQLFTQSQVT